MYKAIVFAGTTEGYEICRFLSANKISALACVATEYGSHSLEAGDYLKIQAKRLDEQEMTELFHKELPEFILDATHPYATEVTKNIKSAALASGISYIRVLRAESQSQNAVYVETAEQAVEYLRDREGRIFLTTGSKELAAFTTLPDYQERIYARVLSLPAVVEACQKLGFEGKHLIAMQGPFSKEMNEATLRQYECQYLVTKDSGKAGGFGEAAELYGYLFGSFYLVNGVGDVGVLNVGFVGCVIKNQCVVLQCVIHPFLQFCFTDNRTGGVVGVT